MKTVRVVIDGTAALLQHRFTEKAEAGLKASKRASHIKDISPRDVAEQSAYRAPNGQLYHPAAAIVRLIREAGGGFKQKGTRKSMKYVVGAAIRLTEDTIPLLSKTKQPLKDFEVDSRPVVIPSTKGRIMCHRPRQDAWMSAFCVVVNEDLIDLATVRELLEIGGRGIGIGDFRPERGGPFGTFAVVEWKEI